MAKKAKANPNQDRIDEILNRVTEIAEQEEQTLDLIENLVNRLHSAIFGEPESEDTADPDADTDTDTQPEDSDDDENAEESTDIDWSEKTFAEVKNYLEESWFLDDEQMNAALGLPDNRMNKKEQKKSGVDTIGLLTDAYNEILQDEPSSGDLLKLCKENGINGKALIANQKNEKNKIQVLATYLAVAQVISDE